MAPKLLLVELILFAGFQVLCSGPCTLTAQQPVDLQATDTAKLAWKRLPDLPNELGVAGPFVGVHNGALIVAGGANFQRPVWESTKSWVDDIWVMIRTEKGMEWKNGGRLPRPLAYGAAVSSSHGVVCIGGNDKDRNYRDVFVLEWDRVQQKVTYKEYPAMPKPCAFGQAILVGEVIYMAGGQSGLQLNSAMSNFWTLNLADRNDPVKFQWRELGEIPFQPRAFNIAAHQRSREGGDDCVYVIGGRCQLDGEVRFLDDLWEFNPKFETWRQRARLPRNVTAGTGIGIGRDSIAVLGGDDGSLFSKTDELKDQHPGFRKEALIYSTVKDVWSSAGPTPQNQVTTIPVVWDDHIIIASGEIRPRVRTPTVWEVKLLEDPK